MNEDKICEIMKKVSDKLSEERSLMIQQIKSNNHLDEWYVERLAAIEAYENVLRWFYEAIKE